MRRLTRASITAIMAAAANATSDGPGAVGSFNSTLAQASGPVWTCLP